VYSTIDDLGPVFKQPYLLPEVAVLLQEPQGSGLEPSQQDLQFLLQFSSSPGLCGHVTPVHLGREKVAAMKIYIIYIYKYLKRINIYIFTQKYINIQKYIFSKYIYI